MRFLTFGLLGVALQAAAYTPLNVTAITTRDGYSVLECWQIESVPVEARAAINYEFGGDLTRAEWSIIKPRTTVGEAWAPAVQLTVIMNGLIRITSPAPQNSSRAMPLPDSDAPQRPETTVAYIQPGTVSSSLVIAADLKNTSIHAGHFTEFPGDEPTVLLQVPWAGNIAPKYRVLGDGPCEKGAWTF
ncbi:uncharacterized protein CTRU02_210701 [Colletotrichum truncatum]|uniref:Uncharacterized protein n=1 Tax=Colletotrichum truncatum TaxID=5467 RepID=A0ACC3YRZ3_COLTU|nr:uncharacterized protein CTRU02_03806 [Colletotrichum truncatum]KAF6796828.1 hypothetical protein CTRU02_03806 [Colletotrichum truncatum]